MEPSLNDMSDYKKPLSSKKKRNILIAFGIAFVVLFSIMYIASLF